MPHVMHERAEEFLPQVRNVPKELTDKSTIQDILAWVEAKNPDIRQAYIAWKLSEETMTEFSEMPGHAHANRSASAAQREDANEKEFQMLQLQTAMTDADIASASIHYNAVRQRIRLAILRNVATWQFNGSYLELLQRQLQLSQMAAECTHGRFTAGITSQSEYRRVLARVNDIQNQIRDYQQMQKTIHTTLATLLNAPGYQTSMIPQSPISINDDLPAISWDFNGNLELQAMSYDVLKCKAMAEMTQVHEQLIGLYNSANPLSLSVRQAYSGSREAALRHAESIEKLSIKKAELKKDLAEILERLQDARRQCELCRDVRIPNAKSIQESATAAYSNGNIPHAMMIEARQNLLAVQMDYNRAKLKELLAQLDVLSIYGKNIYGKE